MLIDEVVRKRKLGKREKRRGGKESEEKEGMEWYERRELVLVDIYVVV